MAGTHKGDVIATALISGMACWDINSSPPSAQLPLSKTLQLHFIG